MTSNTDIQDMKELAIGYRGFMIELGQYFARIKEEKSYEGFADTFIDFVKSPEIGFNVAEVNTYMAMAKKFELLEMNSLPSHHSMKLMTSKHVDMKLLTAAQTLSVTDFKESLKDDETGTQVRTYKYEVIKRVVETGGIKRVYGEELDEAIKNLKEEPTHA